MVRNLDLPRSIADNVSVTDPDIIARYCRDWTGRVVGTTDLLLRPRTHGELVELVRHVGAHKERILVQGGNTSLAGGSVPLNNEILLSTERLTTIRVDPVSMTASVGAGVKLADLQSEIARYGLAFGVDIASRGSATLGGMTATNAGGIHVLRYGPMADNIVDLSYVFGDGSTKEPREALLKDATGPSMARLLVGSEGIFGIITSVTLRLLAQPQHRLVAITPLQSLEEGISIGTKLRGNVAAISAIEFLGPEAVQLAPSNPPWAISPGGALLIEVLSEALTFADQLDELGLDREWVIADDPRRVTDLWSWREEIPGWIARVGKPLKLDLSVPIDRLPNLYQLALMTAKEAGVQCYCFGHLGDGNLHVNLVGEDRSLDRVSRSIYQHVVDLAGAISAEHGIGTLKKQELSIVQSAAERRQLTQLIDIFNPGRVINPNVMMDY
ncbi:MAG: FAD-binding oxidoreductase [Ferrimicrobium acidiphilum]